MTTFERFELIYIYHAAMKQNAWLIIGTFKPSMAKLEISRFESQLFFRVVSVQLTILYQSYSEQNAWKFRTFLISDKSKSVWKFFTVQYRT